MLYASFRWRGRKMVQTCMYFALCRAYIYIKNCNSFFTESTSSFDGVELMRGTHYDFQGLKGIQDQALCHL